ncbi:MAG: hypothetical protein MJ208_01600 [Bacilli bacterium]|nr:hypothetical protein [Bacilli bacterium]
MRKLSLLTLIIPAFALVTTGCNNNKTVNFISVGDAIKFAQENYDPHIHDGYNVEYVFNTNDSKVTDAIVYKKHYYDPTKQTGEYFIEKSYDLYLNLQNIITILHEATIGLGSADLLEFHNTINEIGSVTGYVNYGFTKTNDHLGYYISSNHLTAITGTLGAILEIAEYVFDLRSLVLITEILNSVTARDAKFTADIEFTRFGFLDSIDLKLNVSGAWCDFIGKQLLIDSFYGDYLAIDNTNINLSLDCNYSL